MSEEQLSLFPEMKPPELEAELPLYRPFLPGVKPEEAYLEVKSLAALAGIMAGCSKCGLREGCRQVVFADGNPQARLMLVGEGPGQVEDEQGLPFVGRAGQLLNRILKAASLEREEVYITNVVKCRPPGNRLPNPDEVAACRGCLEAQIRLVKPNIIVCLGLLATRAILDGRATMATIRGKWFTRQGILLMATYHPAALLRREELKRPTWEDFKLIRDRYLEVKRGD